ncbi:hypothetical protein [Caulobacter sp. LARHSG274]
MSGPVYYVDPYATGHHPEYLRFFATQARAAGVELVVWGPQKLADTAWPGPTPPFQLRVTDDFSETGEGASKALLNTVFDAARREQASGVFFAMLDPLALPLARMAVTGPRPGVPWSGIYFRDSFNYARQERGLKGRLKSGVKLAILRLALRTTKLPIATLNPHWRARLSRPPLWLPDCLSDLDQMARAAFLEAGVWPVPRPPAASDDGRVSFLAFGSMAPRKGLLEFLEALGDLPPDLLPRARVVVLGPFKDTAYRQSVDVAIERLRALGVGIELDATYVSNARLDAALRSCDVVHAAYQDHVGSSGVLGLAVQYGRVVIGQGSYQLGDEMRAGDLGPIVNPADRAAYARQLETLLRHPPAVSAGMDAIRQVRNAQAAAEAATALLRSLAGN